MRSVLASLALVAAAFSASAAPVSSYVGTFGSSDYYLVTDSADGMLLWSEAEAAAVGLGGHLAAINSATEESWLRSTISASERLWIGFTDQAVEGTWRWINGDAVTYTHWAGGEPNDGDPSYTEDYAVVNWATDGAWNDLPDNGAGFAGGHRGIVEVARVPEPGTLALAALALAGIGAIRRRA